MLTPQLPPMRIIECWGDSSLFRYNRFISVFVNGCILIGTLCCDIKLLIFKRRIRINRVKFVCKQKTKHLIEMFATEIACTSIHNMCKHSLIDYSICARGIHWRDAQIQLKKYFISTLSPLSGKQLSCQMQTSVKSLSIDKKSGNFNFQRTVLGDKSHCVPCNIEIVIHFQSIESFSARVAQPTLRSQIVEFHAIVAGIPFISLTWTCNLTTIHSQGWHSWKMQRDGMNIRQ